jgi:hypothetical protein
VRWPPSTPPGDEEVVSDRVTPNAFASEELRHAAYRSDVGRARKGVQPGRVAVRKGAGGHQFEIRRSEVPEVIGIAELVGFMSWIISRDGND